MCLHTVYLKGKISLDLTCAIFFLHFQGYFDKTVLYYGFYTNDTIRKDPHLAPYNMQLAYIFTIGLYMAVCFLILLFR